MANLSRINVPLENSSFLPSTYPLRVDLWDLTFFLVFQRKTVSDYPVFVELLANGKLQTCDGYTACLNLFRKVNGKCVESIA